MTRVRASLLSLFSPLIVIALVVAILSIPSLSERVITFVVLAAIALALALRVSFAWWYVKDKGRDEAWGFAAVFGIWGWLVLWSLEDRGFRFQR